MKLVKNDDGVAIPEGFEFWPGDPAEDANGPFFYRHISSGLETLFEVKPHNCNMQGSVHGGMLMMFADYNLCVAAVGRDLNPCVTVSCNNEFLSAAHAGEWLRGEAEVLRKGKSLVFARATIYAGERAVLSSSGVIKMLTPR